MESLSNASKLAFKPTNWLPNCAHAASGHLQPSFVRKGHMFSHSGLISQLVTMLSSVAEIETDRSAFSSGCPLASESLLPEYVNPSLVSDHELPILTASLSPLKKCTLHPSDCTARFIARLSLLALLAMDKAELRNCFSFCNSAVSKSRLNWSSLTFDSAISFA